MELVLRALAVYVILFVLMRLAGQKQFSEMTTFDAVLIIVIAEVTGNTLSGEDYSITATFVVLVTLVMLDIGLSLAKQRWKRVQTISEGKPILLLENGHPIRDHMEKERVDEGDILTAARRHHGLERLDQIKFAVLEREGNITIVPKAGAGA